MNTPTADPTGPPDPAREALIASIARRLDAAEAQLVAVAALMADRVVLSEEECYQLRILKLAPMVYTGSPAVGLAIAFVRRLAARLPERS